MSTAKSRNAFRYVIGIIAITGGLAGMAGLYFVTVPENQVEPLLVVLGIVLGWGGAVVQGEWGSSPAGRQAAEAGLRQHPSEGGGP